MRDHEVNGFLVGEAFMREEDPGLPSSGCFSKRPHGPQQVQQPAALAAGLFVTGQQSLQRVGRVCAVALHLTAAGVAGTGNTAVLFRLTWGCHDWA